MKHTIPTTAEAMSILDKLIGDNTYRGHVERKGFELARPVFPNNYRVVGEYKKEEGIFELRAGYKFPVNVAVILALVLGLGYSIFVFWYYMNWIIPVGFIVLVGIFITLHVYKRNQELRIFLKRFVDLQRDLKQ